MSKKKSVVDTWDDEARRAAGKKYREGRAKRRAEQDRKPLIPPDTKRCQAEIPNGHTFMTLGGVPGRTRCKNKPTVIVTEKKPGKDGQKGSMALCDGCLAQFRKQMPRDYAEIVDIDVKTKKG